MKHPFHENMLAEIPVKKSKRLTKIRDIDFTIPQFAEAITFEKVNYPVSFLKQICKHYKLRVAGNKPELRERIKSFLTTSSKILIIQKIFRGHIVRQYLRLVGPAVYNRKLCMNDTDFLTFQKIEDIPLNEFFSYSQDNNIWGFNILSIYNLFIKASSDGTLNPYTREKLDRLLFSKIKRLINLNKLRRTPVNIILNRNEIQISNKKK